jgi:hypothetical protein
MPGFYSVNFDQETADGQDNTYFGYIVNDSLDYPVSYEETFIFASSLQNINPISLASIIVSKLLVNSSIPINSADIASQATLLTIQTTVDNINSNMALQSTLVSTTNTIINDLNQIITTLTPLTGSNQINFLITDQNSLPVSNVRVTIKNTTSQISLSQGITDINGSLILGLPNGTYNVLFYLPFYTISQPYVLNVTGNMNVPISAISFTPASTAPNMCNIYGFLNDISGNPIVGGVVRIKAITNFPFAQNVNTITGKDWSITTTDGNGYFVLPAVQNSVIEISIPQCFISISEFSVPQQPSLNIATLLNQNN